MPRRFLACLILVWAIGCTTRPLTEAETATLNKERKAEQAGASDLRKSGVVDELNSPRVTEDAVDIDL